MTDFIWHDLLYRPLFNVLFFLYNNFSGGNLGIAVIELTILLRIVLLPFAILSERNQLVAERLHHKIKSIERDYSNDTIGAKERIREVLRLHRVSPWAKSVMLAVQVLVLVLLYQVFISGMTTTQFRELYGWVQLPDLINLNFLGWNVAEPRTLFWPLIVAGFLFLEITLSQRSEKDLDRSQILYRILLPLFSFFALWLLPMVKSLFILTSMAFSGIVYAMGRAARRAPAQAKKPNAHH